MKLVLNLGCGASPLKNTSEREYINMDMLKHDNIINHNLMKTPYPFPNEHFDEIYLFHTIEHIREESHHVILRELRRLVKRDGVIVISYPEFTKCALNYINNKNGERDFWKATIYGRGLTKWDQHCALMDTPLFVDTLKSYGLDTIKVQPERGQVFNTILTCRYGEITRSYESLLEEEFGNTKRTP